MDREKIRWVPTLKVTGCLTIVLLILRLCPTSVSAKKERARANSEGFHHHLGPQEKYVFVGSGSFINGPILIFI